MGPKTVSDIFNSDLGHFIFKWYQTEHCFEVLLIKWKTLYASGGTSKNTSNEYSNRIIRLAVTKTEIFEKVVTVDEYCSRYIFH